MGVRYVRISVTDRCDLRCAYCMPMRSRGAPRSDLLTYEEIVEVVKVLAAQGVRKVRLTGGEPLRRPGIAWLLREVSRVSGIEDLGITTNGTRLAEFVPVLQGAGVRVNVHLDTLDPHRYRERMGGRDPHLVTGAIREAVRSGIPVKINAVCSADTTVDDAVGLVRFGQEVGAPVRFIEAMPVSGVERDHEAREAMGVLEDRIIEIFHLEAMERDGVARMYQGPSGERVGFITPSHAAFCDGCDKVRLSARGRLRTCLFGREGEDLRAFLRSGDRKGLWEAVARAFRQKEDVRKGDLIETMVGIGG